MARLELLREVLSKPKYCLMFAAIAVIIFLLFGNVSGMLQNSFINFKRMIPAAMPDFAFLAVVSILSGLLFAVIFHRLEELRQASMKESAGGIIGAITGYFGIACPSCGLLLFSLLGFHVNLLALYPFIPEIRLLSILLLLVSLFIALGKSKTCNARLKNGKS